MDLDRLDIRLLRHLMYDARMSLTELGSKVGLSATACARRLERLVKEGVIKRFRVELNRKQAGFGMLVIIRVTLERQSEDCLRSFEKAVVRCSSVLSCYLMSGTSDYLVTVAARDIEDYERIHNTQLSRLPHVARLESGFALREIVEREIPTEILGAAA
ncbi:MAG: Lrp/AsnC family transcriptional regulator [Proteobacteria bacterium]|nr:Lrp/AsnC family transcriptional regulator [Pseudomonadota bacterium]